jgi:type I restriction enzyme S subunit
MVQPSQRRIKILEEMDRRLYREWFVHLRFPGHEGCGFVESPLGEIPEGWEVKRLRDVTTTIASGAIPTEDPAQVPRRPDLRDRPRQPQR